MPVNYGKQKTLWKQSRILGKNLFLFISRAWLSHFFSVRFACKELVDLPDSAFSVFFFTYSHTLNVHILHHFTPATLLFTE